MERQSTDAVKMAPQGKFRVPRFPHSILVVANLERVDFKKQICYYVICKRSIFSLISNSIKIDLNVFSYSVTFIHSECSLVSAT